VCVCVPGDVCVCGGGVLVWYPFVTGCMGLVVGLGGWVGGGGGGVLRCDKRLEAAWGLLWGGFWDGSKGPQQPPGSNPQDCATQKS